MWVTHSRMLSSLPRSCLVHPVNRFDSKGWFSSDQVIFLTMKKHAAFKWKDAISGFLVSPGSAEALVRCRRKIKYILIAYFLGNICAKNCRNQTVYVKIIGSYKGGTFFCETQCIYTSKGSCPLMEFWEVQNWLCIQILHSPILAALLHGTRVVGVSKTLQHSTEGAIYIRQGDHHVGHRPTF